MRLKGENFIKKKGNNMEEHWFSRSREISENCCENGSFKLKYLGWDTVLYKWMTFTFWIIWRIPQWGKQFSKVVFVTYDFDGWQDSLRRMGWRLTKVLASVRHADVSQAQLPVLQVIVITILAAAHDKASDRTISFWSQTKSLVKRNQVIKLFAAWLKIC